MTVAIDTLAEAAFRFVGQFVIEYLFVRIFYWPGWFILRIFTLGRYPPLQTEKHNREFVAMIAFVVFLIGLTLYLTNI